TAGQLIAQFGSLEELYEHLDEVSGEKRGDNRRTFEEQARNSKVLATMRRDLDIDCDPGQLVLSSPDRTQLKEMFRRFEFRNLLNRVDLLDEALPAAAPARVDATEVAWREGSFPEQVRGRVALAIQDGRFALAEEDAVTIGDWSPEYERRLRDAEVV